MEIEPSTKYWIHLILKKSCSFIIFPISRTEVARSREILRENDEKVRFIRRIFAQAFRLSTHMPYSLPSKEPSRTTCQTSKEQKEFPPTLFSFKSAPRCSHTRARARATPSALSFSLFLLPPPTLFFFFFFLHSVSCPPLLLSRMARVAASQQRFNSPWFTRWFPAIKHRDPARAYTACCAWKFRWTRLSAQCSVCACVCECVELGKSTPAVRFI